MVKHKFSRKEGFSLLEGTVVLMIVAILFLSTSFLIRSTTIKTEEEDFILRLQQQVLFCQSFAMSHESMCEIIFEVQHRRYIIRKNVLEKPLAVQHIPSAISVSFTRNLNPIRYTLDGNITQAGSMTVTTTKGAYVFVFQIGKGRFYIQKL